MLDITSKNKQNPNDENSKTKYIMTAFSVTPDPCARLQFFCTVAAVGFAKRVFQEAPRSTEHSSLTSSTCFPVPSHMAFYGPRSLELSFAVSVEITVRCDRFTTHRTQHRPTIVLPASGSCSSYCCASQVQPSPPASPSPTLVMLLPSRP